MFETFTLSSLPLLLLVPLSLLFSALELGLALMAAEAAGDFFATAVDDEAAAAAAATIEAKLGPFASVTEGGDTRTTKSV